MMGHQTNDESKLFAEITSKETELFRLAFELAYFIHANKEIAFFIAEDALEGLSTLLGYQQKNRPPSNRLRGFLKWGERSRPVRKTLILNEYQMLQWLVYKESERWELETEEARKFYTPEEEDFIVRYIKHLVFLTTRRGSFYVTLSVCSILHQFDRRETRVFYDILTQSDAARMKDTNYIGKQRLELSEKVFRRFERVARTVAKAGNEKQLSLRPADQQTTNLVKEALSRFTPWGTSCVIGRAFDVTDIPDLYFSETAPESNEDIIEMNRIHTVLHPECFSRFTDELRNYARSLPAGDLDGRCEFETDDRMVLPQFTNVHIGPPRRDRFEPPKLGAEDFMRLRRTLDARGHRKKVFAPQTLAIHADGRFVYSFDPKTGPGKCLIEGETTFIEVRGIDPNGEVILATVLPGEIDMLTRGFADSIMQAGGQKLLLKLTAFDSQENSASPLQMEIAYKQGGPWLSHAFGAICQVIPFLKSSSAGTGFEKRRFKFAAVALIAAVTIALTLFISWSKDDPRIPQQPTAERLSSQSTHQPTPVITEPRPEASPKPSRAANSDLSIVQVRWTTDRNAAFSAVPIEVTRATRRTIDLSKSENKIILSLPLYDSAGFSYSQYRVTLRREAREIWKRSLTAPGISVTGYTHMLEILLFSKRLTTVGNYTVEVEGQSQNGWRRLGSVKFDPAAQP